MKGERVKSPHINTSRVKMRGGYKNFGAKDEEIARKAQLAVEYIMKHQGVQWPEIREALNFGKADRETLMRHMYNTAFFFVDDETGQCYVGKDVWEEL